MLARALRLARPEGPSLARQVAARHEPDRLTEAPRLLPVARVTVARQVRARAGVEIEAAQPESEVSLSAEAERLSRLSGYSAWGMEYLLGNDAPAGSTSFTPAAAERATARSAAAGVKLVDPAGASLPSRYSIPQAE